jgi:hypothetical protein
MGKARKILGFSSARTLFTLLILGVAIGFSPRVSLAFPKGVTLISCDRQGAILELSLPEIRISPRSLDGSYFSDVDIAGWGKDLSAEGNPALPQAGVLLAMPPGAEASMSTEILETKTLALNNPVPTPTWKTDDRGQNLQEQYLPKAAAYNSKTLYPEQWVKLGDPCWLRGHWVVPVRITPVRVRTGLGDALAATRLRIHVKFMGGREGRYVNDPLGEGMAKSEIINYKASSSWQGDPPRPKFAPDQDYGQYKLMVEKDGLYRITYSDLQVAGIDPTTFDPKSLKIYLKGEQIPIYVQGESDHSFDIDDYILFWGQFPRGTYTYTYIYSKTNVYWLDWGGVDGVRVQTRSATPAGTTPLAQYFKSTRHFEVDTIYQKFGYTPETTPVDQWVWLNMDSYYLPEYSYLLNLPRLSILSGKTYDLKISVRGYTYNEYINPDHRMTVNWNDYEAIDAIWNDQEKITPVASIPSSALRSLPALNEIILTAPSVPNVVSNSYFLDYMEVGYWRDYTLEGDTMLFQSPQDLAAGQIKYQIPGVTNPDVELWNLTRMERLTGFQFSPNLTFQDSASDTTYYFISKSSGLLTPEIVPDVPSDWKTTSHGVDYLIVTHEDFYDALTPLVQLYQNRGWRVERAKIGDIYDEFSYGLKDPQALFDFISYAYFSYQQPQLTYVLLVGDASWDYKNQDPLPYVDYLPTHAFRSWKWGETASDNFFAAVGDSAPVPDLYLGRFPVNNQDEINTLVQKSLLYAEEPSGYWRSQALFTNGALGVEDGAYFDSTAQNLITEFFPSWYNPERVYSNPSPPYEQYLGGSYLMMNYINQGDALVSYIGHAGNQMWTTLDQSEIGLLENGIKMPFVCAYSCFTGLFSNTTGFGETFVLKPNGGAIAYWSNAGIGYIYSNTAINTYLFQHLLPDSVEGVPLGEAITEAKSTYYAYHGNVSNVLTTFIFLGDPGARFVYHTPTPADTSDTSPPQVTIQIPGTNFRSGDFIENPVHFVCNVFDSTGLDLTTLSFALTYLNDSQGNAQDSTIAWTWSPDSLPPPGFSLINYPDTLGQHMAVSFNDSLSSGEWKFRLSVSDYFLQGPTTLYAFLRVAYNKLVLEQPLNYPNPFTERTSFTYTLSQPAEVIIRIYTVSGKLIRTISKPDAEVGYNILDWDGRDEEGDPLSNGVYLYKITARNGNQRIDKIEKMIKMR